MNRILVLQPETYEALKLTRLHRQSFLKAWKLLENYGREFKRQVWVITEWALQCMRLWFSLFTKRDIMGKGENNHRIRCRSLALLQEGDRFT